jgi:hypothetical protein
MSEFDEVIVPTNSTCTSNDMEGMPTPIYFLTGKKTLQLEKLGEEAFEDCDDEQREIQYERINSYAFMEDLDFDDLAYRSLSRAMIIAEAKFWDEIRNLFHENVDTYNDPVFKQFNLKDCDPSEDEELRRDRQDDLDSEDYLGDLDFCLNQLMKGLQDRGFESFFSAEDNTYSFTWNVLMADREEIDEHNYFIANVSVCVVTKVLV